MNIYVINKVSFVFLSRKQFRMSSKDVWSIRLLVWLLFLSFSAAAVVVVNVGDIKVTMSVMVFVQAAVFVAACLFCLKRRFRRIFLFLRLFQFLSRPDLPRFRCNRPRIRRNRPTEFLPPSADSAAPTLPPGFDRIFRWISYPTPGDMKMFYLWVFPVGIKHYYTGISLKWQILPSFYV